LNARRFKRLAATPGMAAAVVSLAAVLGLGSCYPRRPSFSPPPPTITSIEGHASFRLTRSRTTAKSRFTFLFLLPDAGRIEVSDPLGRTVSLLFLQEQEAFFVLPRKRLYWRSSREAVLSKLLGFTLSPEEMTDILSGKLEKMAAWELKKDERGRVVGGRRDEIAFEVQRFFDGSRLPQTVSLSGPAEEGLIKILRLNFNQPLKKGAFDLAFLEDPRYSPATWEEIEQWLKSDR
jgi:outer membrane biogenesis lipoprotein LolB